MKSRFRLLTMSLIVTLVLATAAGGLVFTRSQWLPAARRLIGKAASAASTREDDHADHDHGSRQRDEQGADRDDHDLAQHSRSAEDQVHEPDDHQHDEATALRVSKQAEANIGRDLHRVRLCPFARTISVPATVIGRPGRSQVQVTAPFTGLVPRIYRVEGEAVTPGMPLFEMQLTHEELVEAQAEFLRTPRSWTWSGARSTAWQPWPRKGPSPERHYSSDSTNNKSSKPR